MIKANDAADEIRGAVNKEILAILVEEGVKNIDEKMEEEQERVDEAAEKELEREEQEKLIKDSIDAERLDIDIALKKHASDKVTEVQEKIKINI